MIPEPFLDKIIKDITEDVQKVNRRFGLYSSIHEGYAVMLEEFDELWEEVKNKDRNYTRMYLEAKHVACTAIRFMTLVENLKKEKGVL